MSQQHQYVIIDSTYVLGEMIKWLNLRIADKDGAKSKFDKGYGLAVRDALDKLRDTVEGINGSGQ